MTRVYRANNYVVIGNVSSYGINQLTAEINGNNIKINLFGVNKNEIFIPYHEVTDGFGNQVAENVDDALSYVESIIYGSSSVGLKDLTLVFDPPAINYYKLVIDDVDAVSGDCYSVVHYEPSDEIEFDNLNITAFSEEDGKITFHVHCSTGLFVGEYNIKYKVI